MYISRYFLLILIDIWPYCRTCLPASAAGAMSQLLPCVSVRRSASPTAKVTAAAAAIVASSATVGAVANQAVSHDQGPHTPRSQVSLAEGSLTEASSAPGHDSESDGDGGIVVPESALEQVRHHCGTPIAVRCP
jgi:hypothetical protein